MRRKSPKVVVSRLATRVTMRVVGSLETTLANKLANNLANACTLVIKFCHKSHFVTKFGGDRSVKKALANKLINNLAKKFANKKFRMPAVLFYTIVIFLLLLEIIALFAIWARYEEALNRA